MFPMIGVDPPQKRQHDRGDGAGLQAVPGNRENRKANFPMTASFDWAQRSARPQYRVPCDGILGAVGNTPLVRFAHLFPGAGFTVFGKMETFNPGGSMKDRPALQMLADALAKGQITSETTIVESSSGNLAIGLAQACRAHGLRLVVVVDPKTTTSNIKLMHAYGAYVDMVHTPDPETGEFLAARKKRVRQWLDDTSGAINLNQYANPQNPRSHRTGTIREIIEALDGRVDHLLIAVSTCGSLRGAREAVRDAGLSTKITAVDAKGSAVFGTRGPRLLAGHGAGVVPDHMAPDLADDFVLVSDADCVAGCRWLVESEAVMAGASSGGIVAALHRKQRQFEPGSKVVAVICDRGERYLDTVYDDAWCMAKLGCVPSLDDIQIWPPAEPVVPLIASPSARSAYL
jgi:2,3-diaminopropionate biosynthesis protein SbnA